MLPGSFLQLVHDSRKELEHYYDGDGHRWAIIGPLARVNAFVGATNSGKSRFLRGLAALKDYPLITSDEQATAFQLFHANCDILAQTGVRIRIALGNIKYDPDKMAENDFWFEEPLRTHDPSDPEPINVIPEVIDAIRPTVSRLGDPQLDHHRRKLVDVGLPRLGLVEHMLDNPTCYGQAAQLLLDEQVVGLSELNSPDIQPIYATIKPALQGLVGALRLLSQTFSCDTEKPFRVYIPVLRTVAPLYTSGGQRAGSQLLQLSVQTNYGLESTGIEVFTGENLYELIAKAKTSSQLTRQRLKTFEQFLAENFFEGKSVELIALTEGNADVEKPVVVAVEGREERKIMHLGDGIQSVILLMYRLFLADEGTWVFIEEPELNLHPGLQRIFLDVLMNNESIRKKQLTVFFTTHSNHLLGMLVSEFSNEASVFSFERAPDADSFFVRLVHGRSREPFSLLGVTNSSVLLANCTVWVEGVTDRRYLRAYLNAYMGSAEFSTAGFKRFQEDIHYAFLEYAGSNLAHYLFDSGVPAAVDPEAEGINAHSLTNPIFVLADKDEGKDDKHTYLTSLSNTNFQYRHTVTIEVENLISAATLRAVLPQLSKTIKAEDIAELQIMQADYRDTRLGEYLLKTVPNCPLAVKENSGTLSSYL